MKRLLLIEDDTALGATLSARLQEEGYALRWARSVAESTQALADNPFDLLIVDVGLPDGSGFDVARTAKAQGTTPILFLTAMNSAEHRLEGFEIGAEDFVPKPFHLRELLLRIKKALTHRSVENNAHADEVKIGNVTINFAQMSIFRPPQAAEFPPVKDFKILELLIKSCPKVVSREQIMSSIWGKETDSTPRTIDNAILRLRQSLGEHAGRSIRSVRGIGYQWVKSSEEDGKTEAFSRYRNG
jgi:two-component system phosphate regulon response regulator PhoB